MKRLLIVAMVLCMVFGLCACGQGIDQPVQTTGNTAPETTAALSDATETVDNGKVTYTVKVVDEGGNPVVSAAVQLCKDSCLPGMTNAEGIATFNVVEDDYKISFMMMPEGFVADAEEFYFAEGSYELTITLKAAA